MTLLLPLALPGLLVLPLILLLHLLRNRRELRPISSLRLWQGLEQSKRGGLPRSIPLSLMLLLQLLVAGAITVALARPAISYLLYPAQHTIFLLDTSTSMAAANNTGTQFDEARQVIQNHVQGMASGDSVTVISLAPQPEILLSGAGSQQTALLPALDALLPGATGTNLNGALTLANGLIDEEIENKIIVLTDGSFTIDAQKIAAAMAPLEWQLIPALPAGTGNQALFNVSSRPLPNGRQRVFARVVNYNDAPVSRTLRLFADDTLATEEVVQLAGLADATRVWTLPENTQTAAVALAEPDTLPPDNRAELFLANQSGVRLLLVSKTPDALARAFAVQPGAELTVIQPEALSTHNPEDFDLAIFDGLLPFKAANWPKTTLLVVNPPSNNPLLPVGTNSQNLIPVPTVDSPILTGIDFSGVYFRQAPELTVPQWATLDLSGSDGSEAAAVPLIFHGSPQNGSRVMVWTFDLGTSNLAGRLAFPLLAANTLSTLLAPAPPATILVGEPVTLPANHSVEIPDGHRLFLDAERAESIFRHTQQPGLYKIYNENNEWVAGFAVHAASPLESNLGEQTSLAQFESVPVTPVAMPQPETLFDEFWPWLAVAAWVIIIFEGWLAWRR